MQFLKATRVTLATIVMGATCGAIAPTAQSATDADRAFVAKVSEGGLYEVEAGKVAAMHGKLPAVKDFGVLDAHDHEAVNNQLKHIAGATGVSIAPGFNAEFSRRLAKLKAIPPSQFDSYYIADMKQIHNNDEGLFAKEAEQGSAAYQQFAHQTAVLVNAHLGWLNTL